MTTSLSSQVAALLLCLAAGTGLGLFYDLLRQLRLAMPWSWLRGALDLLFWAGAWGTWFACGITLGGGYVRLYMALCLLLGAGGYFALASPWVRALLGRVARGVGRLLGWLTAPVRGLILVLAAPFIKIFRRRKKRESTPFPFSPWWSKMYCHIQRGPRGAPGKEAASHVPLPKGGSSGEDPPAHPAHLPGHHPGGGAPADSSGRSLH